jgi:2-polyprenyl-6-methoxyphenol hydroxylase-like FAD-dependent oxidoreductase
VVFWGDLLDELYRADPQSAREIEQASFPWAKQVVEVRGQPVSSAAPLGYGIRRQRLLDILVNRALDAGVRIEFCHEVTTAAQVPDTDLIVACDGVNSRIRQEAKGIHTDVHVGDNKYIWPGTDKVFDSFMFPFRKRQAAIRQSQLAARLSAQWFENVPRYADLTPRQFCVVLRRRKSPLLPRLSPRLYYWLYPTSRELPLLRRLRRWVGPPVIKIYSRIQRSPLRRHHALSPEACG